MKLDVFLIADAASGVEGKLFVHGGGVGRIDAPIWPWSHPMMSVVIRFVIDEDEQDVPHATEVRLLDPEGEPVIDLGPFEWPARAVQSRQEGEQVFWDLVLGVAGFRFETQGVYVWEVKADETIVRTFAFPIRLMS